MEAVLQSKGLLSLPPNPKTRSLLPSHGLRQRILSTNPRNLSGFSLSSNGFQRFQGFVSKNPPFCSNERVSLICRAEAAAAPAADSDGQSGFGEIETPKFLGIEVETLKKIIPLGLMFFCILFNYTILRDTKDVLVVTAKGSSAEIIPFLKTWVNLPMAVGFMLLYTKMANVLPRQALFYSVIVPFIAFFGAFGFLLYPLSNYIHPQAFADKLLNALGPRFLGPLAIMRIWSFCLFYVMAELWGSVVVSVLFWGFANQITTVDEAKKFYPLFGLGANVALIFSGRTVKYFSNMRKHLGPGVDGWAISLKAMMSIVVGMGLAICFLGCLFSSFTHTFLLLLLLRTIYIINQFSLYEILLSPNMFNFEDELIIQPGISWLIWIQLLVILLLFFLCCLTIFAIDFSKSSTADFNSTAAIASSSSTTRFLSHSAHNGKNILPNPNIRIGPNPPRNTQVANDQSTRGEITSSTNRRITQVGEGTVIGGEGSQETKLDLHPCSYFRLAKSAFLRCLGLDSSNENSISDERQRNESRKSKES